MHTQMSCMSEQCYLKLGPYDGTLKLQVQNVWAASQRPLECVCEVTKQI